MDKKREFIIASWLMGGFALAYFLPVGTPRFDNAVTESLELIKWYAQEHVILCLLPAFWIAGAIATFISQASVMRYFGPTAPKPLAYGVGAVSGTILAVCSCTVLPLFAGIYRMGAGLGPAVAFLYSGPAINALAIILTAKVLGAELGLARAIGAIFFSLLIGLLMAFFFRKEEAQRILKAVQLPEAAASGRPLWQSAVFFAVMLALLVFANWAATNQELGFFTLVFAMKWKITSTLAIVLAVLLWRWYKIPATRLFVVGIAVLATAVLSNGHVNGSFFVGILGLTWLTAGQEGELGEWFEQTWSFTKQIMPLLLGGVMIAGLLLGRPGHEALLPSSWISDTVGGNSLLANLFAAVAGAFMYFATLTEIPILQGLLGNGMGNGPALTLLLAGPALSLPSMLVIHSVIGFRKTMAYVGLVIVLATFTGWVYGMFF